MACDTLVRPDGTVFAVLASHAAEPLTVTPMLAEGVLVTRPGMPVTLDPFGIKIFPVTGSGAAIPGIG